jgi:hypothetical protein
MIDYQEDVSSSEHVLEVVSHCYDSYAKSGMGDFVCKFGDGERTVRVDLMSGSRFPDDFDYASLVGKHVKVSHSHGFLFIANDAQIIEA